MGGDANTNKNHLHFIAVADGCRQVHGGLGDQRFTVTAKEFTVTAKEIEKPDFSIYT